MVNEINIVKKIVLNEKYLVRIDEDFTYYQNSLESTYERMQGLLSTLKRKNTERVEPLIRLHGDFLGILSDFHQIRKITDYAFRKNYLLSPIITIHFDEKKSIHHLLSQTVDVMLHLKNTVPVTKCSYSELEKAYVTIHKFTEHGHYLPNLSKNKDEHHIKDILLHLKHVEKTVSIVYEHGVMSIVRKIGWQN